MRGKSILMINPISGISIKICKSKVVVIISAECEQLCFQNWFQVKELCQRPLVSFFEAACKE